MPCSTPKGGTNYPFPSLDWGVHYRALRVSQTRWQPQIRWHLWPWVRQTARGAGRYLIAYHLDIAGARWGPDGSEPSLNSVC